MGGCFNCKQRVHGLDRRLRLAVALGRELRRKSDARCGERIFVAREPLRIGLVSAAVAEIRNAPMAELDEVLGCRARSFRLAIMTECTNSPGVLIVDQHDGNLAAP